MQVELVQELRGFEDFIVPSCSARVRIFENLKKVL